MTSQCLTSLPLPQCQFPVYKQPLLTMLHRLDAVERAIEREMIWFRAQSLEAYLTVEVSIRRDRLSTGAMVNGKLFRPYVLQVFGDPEEKVMARRGPVRVDIIRGLSHLTCMEHIMLIASKHSNPLDDYSISAELRQARAWEAQRRWWIINDQTFALLRLPRELRDLIYTQVCGSRCTPYASRRSAQSTNNGTWSFVAIMLANRQLHHEVSQHISVFSRFHFEHKNNFRRALQDPSLMMCIRHLHLAFDLEHYLLFFGIGDGALESRLEPDPLAQRLRRLPLNSLSIRTTMQDSTQSSAMRWMSRLCSRCARSLLIRAAWPYIRGHSCSLLEDFNVDERALFASKALAARSQYLDWKDKAAANGLSGSLDTWDKWLGWFKDDVEGGIAIQEDLDPGQGCNEITSWWPGCARSCIA